MATGDELRDRGIDQVEAAASASFKAAALAALKHIAQTAPEFTSDRVWALVERRGFSAPREPRVMGAIMRSAIGHGWIEPTDVFRKSIRPQAHSRSIRVWASKLTVK